MPIRFFCALITLLPVTALAAGAVAQGPQSAERVVASFLLARGRLPADAEVREWTARASGGLTDLMEQHRQQLQADPSAQQAVHQSAGRDGLGAASEPRGRATSAETYAELMQRHLERLRQHPDEYEQVIQRAYRFVLHRDAYDLELAYWQKHDTLTHVLLVGCIEDWARRNQPGLMVTAGTPTISANSRFVTTARASASVAGEARPFAGLPPPSDAILASGRTLVAVGAESVVSSRAIPLFVVGKAE